MLWRELKGWNVVGCRFTNAMYQYWYSRMEEEFMDGIGWVYRDIAAPQPTIQAWSGKGLTWGRK